MTEITVTTQYTPAEPAIAIAAIRDLVATVERVQQHELVEEFVALFRSDAIWTTGAGKQLLGRDAIADFTAQVLPVGPLRATAPLTRWNTCSSSVPMSPP